MNGATLYVNLGFALIPIANLVVICLLIVVFVLAVLLRFHVGPRTSTLEPLPDANITDSEALS